MFRQQYESCVGEIHGDIGILLHKGGGGKQYFQLRCFKYFDAGCFDELCEAARSGGIAFQQVHGFCNNRTGGAEGSGKLVQPFCDSDVLGIVVIQVGDDWTGIDKKRSYRLFCFLRCLAQSSFAFLNLTDPLRCPALSERGVLSRDWVRISRTTADRVFPVFLARSVNASSWSRSNRTVMVFSMDGV
jgi:hypothetical protein